MTCPECVHVQAEIVLYWSLYLSTLTTTISALQTNRDNKLVFKFRLDLGFNCSNKNGRCTKS